MEEKYNFCSIMTRVRLDFNVDFLPARGTSDIPVCREPSTKKNSVSRANLILSRVLWFRYLFPPIPEQINHEAHLWLFTSLIASHWLSRCWWPFSSEKRFQADSIHVENSFLVFDAYVFCINKYVGEISHDAIRLSINIPESYRLMSMSANKEIKTRF